MDCSKVLGPPGFIFGSYRVQVVSFGVVGWDLGWFPFSQINLFTARWWGVNDVFLSVFGGVKRV